MSVLDSASAVESPTPPGPRVNVLAFPAPTTTRFIVVFAATLAAALFVGDWLHGFLHGQQWVRDVGDCLRQNDYLSPVAGATEQLGRQQAASDCYAGVQHSRAAFAVGSTVVVMLIGICVLFIAPTVIERRRKLQVLNAKLAPVEQAVSELAMRAGLHRMPRVMLGSAKQADAFSYGSPERYRIALPRAVVAKWRNRAMFDALVLHELSHIRNRDVSLSWLTRGVMYAVVPVLALPLLVGAATGVFSLFPDYIWRAAVLAALVWAISAALLRSREHDADLRAAGLLGQTTTLVGLLGLARPQATDWWRRVRANHPAPSARTQVLAQPGIAAAVRFLDGLAPCAASCVRAPSHRRDRHCPRNGKCDRPLSRVGRHRCRWTVTGLYGRNRDLASSGR